MKTCTSCREVKPLTDFYSATTGAGHRSKCKQCEAAAQRERRGRTAPQPKPPAEPKPKRDQRPQDIPAAVAALPCGHQVWVAPMRRRPFEGETLTCPSCGQAGPVSYGEQSRTARGWFATCPSCGRQVAAWCTGELIPHHCAA